MLHVGPEKPYRLWFWERFQHTGKQTITSSGFSCINAMNCFSKSCNTLSQDKEEITLRNRWRDETLYAAPSHALCRYGWLLNRNEKLIAQVITWATGNCSGQGSDLMAAAHPISVFCHEFISFFFA